jgi:hypothetical protein
LHTDLHRWQGWPLPWLGAFMTIFASFSYKKKKGMLRVVFIFTKISGGYGRKFNNLYSTVTKMY